MEKLDKTRCIKEVWPPDAWHWHRCARKGGYGPNGHYCKQHDPVKIAVKEAEKEKAFQEKCRKLDEENKRYDLIQKLCGDIPTNKLSKYKLVLKRKSR